MTSGRPACARSYTMSSRTWVIVRNAQPGAQRGDAQLPVVGDRRCGLCGGWLRGRRCRLSGLCGDGLGGDRLGGGRLGGGRLGGGRRRQALRRLRGERSAATGLRCGRRRCLRCALRGARLRGGLVAAAGFGGCLRLRVPPVFPLLAPPERPRRPVPVCQRQAAGRTFPVCVSRLSRRRGLGGGGGRSGTRPSTGRGGGRGPFCRGGLRSCGLPGGRGRRGSGGRLFRAFVRARSGGLFLFRRLVPHPVGDQQNLADAREHGTQRVRRCLLNPFAYLREAHIESLPERGRTRAGCHTEATRSRSSSMRFPAGTLAPHRSRRELTKSPLVKAWLPAGGPPRAGLWHAVGCAPSSLA